MKILSTISMALVFSALTIAAAPVFAGSKSHSSGNSHSSNSSSGCNSGCCHKTDSCHKNPCDPGKGTKPPIVVDPVHHPKFPIDTIHPIMSPPNLAPTATTPPKGKGGLLGTFTGVTIVDTNSGATKGKGGMLGTFGGVTQVSTSTGSPKGKGGMLGTFGGVTVVNTNTGKPSGQQFYPGGVPFGQGPVGTPSNPSKGGSHGKGKPMGGHDTSVWDALGEAVDGLGDALSDIGGALEPGFHGPPVPQQ